MPSQENYKLHEDNYFWTISTPMGGSSHYSGWGSRMDRQLLPQCPVLFSARAQAHRGLSDCQLLEWEGHNPREGPGTKTWALDLRSAPNFAIHCSRSPGQVFQPLVSVFSLVKWRWQNSLWDHTQGFKEWNMQNTEKVLNPCFSCEYMHTYLALRGCQESLINQAIN